MADRERVIAWLNDAHAMERSIAQVLKNHAGDAKDRPQIQARNQQHLDESNRHAELVAGCIRRLGGGVSALKTGVATMMGTVQGMTTGLFRDELVKNALHDYGTEHFEMACYRALIAVAQEVGDQETAAVCQQIIADEEAMAAWLNEQLPGVVVETLRAPAVPMAGSDAQASQSAPTA